MAGVHLVPADAFIDPTLRTLWFTGLPGAGKSTLADALCDRLRAAGLAYARLDGDGLRGGLNADLGFSPADRRENIRRAAEVARLFNDAGLLVVASFVSPQRADRDLARAIIGSSRFVEIFVDASLQVCESRDPKGMYKRARAGEIAMFTGVSASYEPPSGGAVIRVDTNHDTPRQSLAVLLRAIPGPAGRLAAEVDFTPPE